MTPIAQAMVIAVLSSGTGAETDSVPTGGKSDMAVADRPWTAPPVRDTGQSVGEAFRFTDGGFLSNEGDQNCRFGHPDDRIWIDPAGLVHAAPSTRFPTTPHVTVCYDSLAGGEIAVDLSSPARRWSRTHQAIPSASGDELPAESGISG